MVFSKIELLKYYLLQNRYSWSSLTKEQKNIIYNSNIVHNNIRDDYKNPALYQNGLNYNSNIDRSTVYRGKITKNLLNKYDFKSVLEIGPGAGFITKIILANKPEHYVAVDIVQPFLDFCKNAIADDQDVITKCDFVCGDITDINLKKKFDVIFFLSTLHHIPNRRDFLNKLVPFCHQNTVIISVEPTHYLPRILKLLKRLPTYLSDTYVKYNNYQNLSTHHFLTLNEYKSFDKFQVVEYGFNYSNKIPIKFFGIFSYEMYVVLRPYLGELS